MSLAAGRRRDFYTIIVGTWVIVTVYAILHDQYLVRIAPEHFTVYHEPLWGITDPPLLAAAYAFCAAPLPALALGCVAAFIAHAGTRPPLRPKHVILGVVVVTVATEFTSAASGLYAWKSGSELYPTRWYPDRSLPLITTQTIQVTCYLSAALYSCVLFAYLIWRRVSRPDYRLPTT